VGHGALLGLGVAAVFVLAEAGGVGWTQARALLLRSTVAQLLGSTAALTAVGYGIDMIKSGRADVVVAGGTEAAIMALNLGAFAVMRALSLRNDEPEAASHA